MDVDHPVPLLRANLGKTDEVADSSVVDQDIDTTMVREESAEGVLNLGRVSPGKSDGAVVSAPSPNGLRRLGCWFERTVIDDHMGPTVGENIGDGRTQPAPCTRDHGNLAGQVLLIWPHDDSSGVGLARWSERS